ncbi:hypothetical protein [Mycobacteroides abscessus]|uniref:hypothetical protein n=1 Tax=Mycobacteroides abscessus TaxID=36809 RepID=UPI000C2678E3|nr:hypothetical protein [Mycobacteroides abscessus]
MSDEPSDAQKLIAEVMVTHALVYDDWAVLDADFYTCACGWHLCSSASVHDHAAHVAVEVDKALGVLTPQTRPVNLRCDCGNEADLSWCDEECGRFHPTEFEHGWVSGWTVTE